VGANTVSSIGGMRMRRVGLSAQIVLWSAIVVVLVSRLDIFYRRVTPVHTEYQLRTIVNFSTKIFLFFILEMQRSFYVSIRGQTGKNK